MRLPRRITEPGFIVSAVLHGGALVAVLATFSCTPPLKLDDNEETVPIEMVTDSEFNQVMKGDKSATEVRPDASTVTEQAAPEVAATSPAQTADEQPPPPPTPPVKAAELPPPPDTPPPPELPVPMPPVRPDPPQPQAKAPPVPTPPVRDAEPVEPKPEPKPKPPPPKPVPVPPRPEIVKLHEPKPAPTPKPRPAEKPKLDQLAKMIEDQPTDTTPPPKPSPVRKPVHQPSEDAKFDPTDISRLLSSDAPAQKASAGHATTRLASLGSPTASAAKMSPSLWGALDGFLQDQYRQCWSYLGLSGESKYVPQVRVLYSPDGSLQAQPVLANPPSDPAMQSLADSALRAVRRCNPLKIPDEFAPYYDQWKGRVLRFDPQEMAG